MDFKTLIENNRQNVQNIIKMITHEQNEDIEQDVYIKVLKNSDKYKEQGNFKAWICTVAKNLSKDYLKSAAKKHEQNSVSNDAILLSVQDNKVTPEQTLIRKRRQKRISDAINSLKPKFKEVIILCEIEDYSYEQAAKKLNVPTGTVKSRLYNAKKELAEILKDLL